MSKHGTQAGAMSVGAFGTPANTWLDIPGTWSDYNITFDLGREDRPCVTITERRTSKLLKAWNKAQYKRRYKTVKGLQRAILRCLRETVLKPPIRR